MKAFKQGAKILVLASLIMGLTACMFFPGRHGGGGHGGGHGGGGGHFQAR